jgi:hypothetical protein
MQLKFALLLFAVVAVATAGLRMAVWNDSQGLGRKDVNLRVIHYDTNYELSARRREPAR